MLIFSVVQFDFTQKSVFIMVGYPGSGKSTLAKKICEECHCEYLSSDEIREKVFASKRFDTAGDKAVDGLRQQAYQLMYDTAATLLRQGRKVVLDATHLEPKKRQPVVQQLTKVRQSNQFCYVLVTTPVEEIDQRMQQRAAEIHNPGESLYDAWKRVYGYFEANRQKGLLSWPDPQQEKIDCITYEELSFQLA